MSRTFLFLFLIAFISACNNNNTAKKPKQFNENEFTISGTLQNGAGKTIKLDQFGSTGSIHVDSAEIADDGSFSLRGSTNEPNIFILFSDRSNFNYLIADKNEDIKITGDYSKLNLGLDIENSPGSILLQELNRKLNDLQAGIDSLRGDYNAAQESGNMTEKTRLENISQEMVARHTEYLKGFVNEHPSSLASIAALFQRLGRNSLLAFEENTTLYQMVDSALMSKYPNNYHVKEFHKNYLQLSQPQEPQAEAMTPRIGAEAPDITLPSPDGNTYSLSDLRGKYVLLDFWASWCRPCRAENPNVVENYKRFHDKGLEIFSVSLDKEKAAWEKAIQDDQLVWPWHVSDLQYWSSAPAKKYGVNSIPANFLIDPQGKIIATNLRGPALGQKLAEIFSK